MTLPTRRAKSAVLTGLALALPLLGVSPAASSAEEFYAHAAEQMRRHAEPAFATYDASISGLSCSVEGVGIACTLGRSTAKSDLPFLVDLRESDGRIALRKESASVILGDSFFLDATSPGVDTIIRHGFTGTGSAVRRPPSPRDRPGACRDRGRFSAFGVQFYRLRCRRRECSTGDAGHGVSVGGTSRSTSVPVDGATVDLPPAIYRRGFNAR